MKFRLIAIGVMIVAANLPNLALARVVSINAPSCHLFLENIDRKNLTQVYWSADWIMGWISAKADADKFDLANQDYYAMIRRLEAICRASMPNPLGFTDIAPQIYKELRQGRFKCKISNC